MTASIELRLPDESAAELLQLSPEPTWPTPCAPSPS